MEFYCINFNSRKVDLFVEVREDYDEQGLCSGKVRPEEIIQLKKSQGRYKSDIIRLQDPFNFIISDTLYEKLKESGVTGWTTYPVQVSGVEGSFHGFQTTGKCGPPMRPKDSGFVTGFRFDISTWDGSDFIIPDSTLMILCTEVVKNILEGLNIKNLKIENIEKMEWYNA